MDCQAEAVVDLGGYGYGLHVQKGVLRAYGLYAYLVELSKSACLGALLAELGPDVIKFLEFLGLIEFIFHIGTHNPGGVLRAEGDGGRATPARGVLSPRGRIGEGVHLLLHDVGGLADTPYK